MPSSLPHLQLRPIDFFWRRRLAVASSPCDPISFSCFRLKINVPREAAAVAARIGLPTLNKWVNADQDNDVVSTEGRELVRQSILIYRKARSCCCYSLVTTRAGFSGERVASSSDFAPKDHRPEKRP